MKLPIRRTLGVAGGGGPAFGGVDDDVADGVFDVVVGVFVVGVEVGGGKRRICFLSLSRIRNAATAESSKLAPYFDLDDSRITAPARPPPDTPSHSPQR